MQNAVLKTKPQSRKSVSKIFCVYAQTFVSIINSNWRVKSASPKADHRSILVALEKLQLGQRKFVRH